MRRILSVGDLSVTREDSHTNERPAIGWYRPFKRASTTGRWFGGYPAVKVFESDEIQRF
jgi:hypothetical protein